MRTVLIAEDEAIIAMDLTYILESLGYNVLRAVTNGKNAISAAPELKPDIIFMDINLKGELDGIDTAVEILSKFDPAIIFLSAYTTSEKLDKIKNLKKITFVSKPFGVQDIKKAIEKIMK